MVQKIAYLFPLNSPEPAEVYALSSMKKPAEVSLRLPLIVCASTAAFMQNVFWCWHFIFGWHRITVSSWSVGAATDPHKPQQCWTLCPVVCGPLTASTALHSSIFVWEGIHSSLFSRCRQTLILRTDRINIYLEDNASLTMCLRTNCMHSVFRSRKNICRWIETLTRTSVWGKLSLFLCEHGALLRHKLDQCMVTVTSWSECRMSECIHCLGQPGKETPLEKTQTQNCCRTRCFLSWFMTMMAVHGWL